jgi:ATP-dependent exoDNAse (exonuclease V) beta subunit
MVSRDLAMAVGTAIHGFLEMADLGSDLSLQVRESRDQLVAEVARDLGADRVSEAEKAVDDMLARITAGRILERLSTIGSAVVARELPVYGWEEGGDGPGAVISGIVDLVYRDPDDERLVVADYKTDVLDGDDALEQRVGVYTPQVGAYARILRDALDLDEEPHTELWFLAADRVIRI